MALNSISIMKKYICISKVLLAFFILSLVSCYGKFILDPIDPRLPKYTDSGNDAAGALVNKEVWKSLVKSQSELPFITNFLANDSLVLHFEGAIADTAAIMVFYFTGLGIQSFDNLILLKNKKISLDGLRNVGLLAKSWSLYSPLNPEINGIGQIYFKDVTLNYISNSLESVTVSGTFGFTFRDSSSVVIEVSYGRFDYNIPNSKFMQIR